MYHGAGKPNAATPSIWGRRKDSNCYGENSREEIVVDAAPVIALD
jgi:hypothetical protein